MTTKISRGPLRSRRGQHRQHQLTGRSGQWHRPSRLYRLKSRSKRHHQSTALELAERKIRVNAIMPGYFDTEGARAFGVQGSAAEAQLLNATPLEKRPGHPSDLSPVALFLGLLGFRLDDGGDFDRIRWHAVIARTLDPGITP